MPHELGTARCPVTNLPIGASMAIPMPTTASEESDATTFLPRVRKAARFVDGWMLDGRYRMGARIASGAMGAVYRARHVRLERGVAIKVIGRDHAVGGPEERRLQQEGRLGARVCHPNVCAVHDLGLVDDGAPYVVMELLEGETVKARIARMGRVHPSEALRIARSVVRALDAVHSRGIVHRDVKPSNVFLARDGDREVVKLCDFGLAFDVDIGPQRTDRGHVIAGTPPYVAPEVLLGQIVDARSDLWSLGVTLYEMLTGKQLFPHDPRADHREFVKRVLRQPIRPPSALRADVPPAADDCVMGLLEREPEHRFGDAAVLDASLAAALVAIDHPVDDDSEPTLASGGYQF